MYSGESVDALTAVKEFMAEMKVWESKYHTLLRQVLNDAEKMSIVKAESIQAKWEILESRCSKAVIQRASKSVKVQSPTTFDPDRDVVELLESLDSVAVISHQQTVGLQSHQRFRLERQATGRWIIQSAELLDEVAEKWEPLIL
jgi:hypothetical protein